MGPETTRVVDKALQPSRTRAHRPRSHYKSGKRSKANNCLDAEELYRRLEQYKQAQDKEIDRRRRAKSKKPQVAQVYHHVPQCAASDFVNTATPDFHDEQNVHPLSRALVRSTDFANPCRLAGDRQHADLRYFKRQDKAEQLMALAAERNQFQRSKALQKAAKTDEVRDLNKIPQRGFDEHSAANFLGGSLVQGSTPVLCNELADPEAQSANVKRKLRLPKDRHNWVQADEPLGKERNLLQDLLPMFRRTNLGTVKRESFIRLE